MKHFIDEELWALILEYSTPEHLAEEALEEKRAEENRKLDASIRKLKAQELGSLTNAGRLKM